MDATASMPDEILAFLAEKGYRLVPHHFKGFTGGYASGNVTGNLKDAMKNYEIWHLTIEKIGDPESAANKRVIYRPTKTGFRVEWGDDSNE